MMRTTLNRRRSRTGCSILALATVLAVGASPAAGQSFQGSGSFSSGTGTISASGNTTSISVTSPTAVINWIPTDNAANANVPIAFQPAGTFADFSGAGNYAVLNRINVADASRVIQLDGTIRTVVNGALNGTGSIYFYSPSGFLLGGSSVINVPSLVLSALPIVTDGGGNFVIGADRSVTFGPAVSASASITTNPGSTITANMTGSYVAMVAPRVVHHGSITTNGQAALVAAEAATINFSPDGLFDISVTTGTADANGIALHGDINGQASTGAGDNNRIYAVAVPKNDALTMVIGSGADLGFDIAGAANVEGNAIVLSAGHNVTDGLVNTLPTSATSEAAMSINAPRATSAVTAVASGDMHLFANAGQVSTFASNVTLRGDNEVFANAAGAGSSLTIAGNLTLSSIEYATGNGTSHTGGFVALYASPNGTVSIGGNTLLQSVGYGGDSNVAGINAGTGTGGSIWVQSEGSSSLTLNGTLTATSAGQGGHAYANNANSGDGSGGEVRIRTFGANAVLNVAGATLASSSGNAGNIACGGCNGLGGTGSGGLISVSSGSATGALNLAGLTISANGQGGNAVLGTGGTGDGGTIDVFAQSGATLNIASLSADANGTGGQGATGGQGRGGTATIQGTGTVNISGAATANAGGYGGSGISGAGGNAYGGISRLRAIGGTVTVGGTARLRADAAAGAGAYGEGGDAQVRASGGGDIVLGSLNATADGRGGGDSGLGAGAGQGGTALIEATGAGSTVTINNSLAGGNLQDRELLSADGFGGGTGVGGATAGTGTGGTAEIKALSSGSVSLPSAGEDSLVRARGYGGTPLADNTTGGLGVGGAIDLRVDGGTLTAGRVQLSSIGQGGEAAANAAYNSHGGDGTGGTRQVNVLNGGNLTIAIPGGVAGGVGGLGTGTGSGGDGSGGSASLIVDNAVATFTGNSIISNQVSGGNAQGSGNGGSATAGSTNAEIRNGGVVNLTGSAELLIGSVAFGGQALGAGNSGNAQGGDSSLTITGGTVNGGHLRVGAWGQANGGGAFGGNGQGGTASLWLNNASITGQALTVNANGVGGSTNSGSGDVGGNGTAGTARLHNTGGSSTVNLTGELRVLAQGGGGSLLGGGGQAGNGSGGNASLYAFGGSTLTISAQTTVDASGFGGDGVEGGAGGTGTGSFAEAGAYGNGALTVNGALNVLSKGVGGYGLGAAGGDGTGHYAGLFADGGSVIVNGSASLDASGEGGDGDTGGDGVGGGERLVNFNGAHIYARNGTITIDGSAVANSSGTGGDGANGGAGGNGEGGFATIHAANSDLGPSAIMISGGAEDSASVSTDGTGGAGGDGVSGNVGGAGGAGGSGTGGWSGITAAAGNGEVDIAVAFLSSQGTGGAGGDGGNGDGGAGGSGGAGGNATGGGINVGTESGAAQATASNLGLGTYGSIEAISSATGGRGGDGGSGATAGDGGAGGSGDAGSSILLVRGSTVDAGFVQLTSTGSGGDGGFGADGGIDGVGGHGYAGEVGIVSTSRYLLPAQHATLNVDTIYGTAAGVSGIGSVNGSGIVEGGSGLEIDSSTVKIGTLDFDITGSSVDGGADPSYIYITNSTVDDVFTVEGEPVDVASSFAFSTVGNLFVHVDNGSLTTDALTLNAGDFVAFDGIDPPANMGTIFAGSATVTTGNNFIAFAHWDVANTFVVDAPGLIDLFNVTGGNGIDFSAGSSIAIDELEAGTYIDLLAAGAIETGAILAGTTVNIQSTGSSVTVPNVDAGGNVTLRGGTTVTAADIDSGGNIFARSFGGDLSLANLDSVGSMQLYSSEDILIGGDIDAGTSLTSLATGLFDGNAIGAGTFIDIGTGGGIMLGDLVAGDDIDLSSSGAITILTALAGETINFETEGTLTAGNLTAGDSVLGQAMGAITVGTVSAGIVDPSTAAGAQHRVSFASGANITTGAVTAAGNIGFGTPGNLATGNLDSGGGIMALVGGNIALPTVQADDYVFLADYSMSALGGDFETFDRSAVLAADPVLTGGSITLTGPLTAGTFVTAAAGTNLNYLSIAAGGNVDLRAGNDVAGGAIGATEGYLSIDVGGAIAVAALSAGGDIDLDSVGNILFTTANAGGEFDFDTSGSVNGGSVVAGAEIGGSAQGSVTLGNLTAGLPQDGDFSVGISAVGNIDVGDVSGANRVGFAAQGNLTTGTINAGELFLAMVGGNFTSGAITTTGADGGEIYIADDSMFATGGGTWDGEGDFDPSVVLALDPVRTGGAITINGAVNTGRFRAAAGTSLTTGAINSGDGIGLDANGAITTGNLVAGNFVLANGGSITTGSIDADSVAMESTGGNITIGGDVTADGLVELDAFGNILTDNITAGTIDLAAGGSITTDNLTTLQPLLLAAAEDVQPLLVPDAEGNITLIAGGNILTGDISAAQNILLATPGMITGETIEAGGMFMALAHGDMSFGDATASEVFLADFAMLIQNGGGGQNGATCVGNCGTSGADGVVTAPPSGSTYHYVSTEGGVAGAGQLPGEGGTNGSQYTTSAFGAAAGEDLEFWFNYVTSDGSGFADYAWAALLTSSFDPVAILFTARTQPSGTIVPGFDLPGVEATLNPASVPIIDGGPAWSPLGDSSGSCYGPGCGYTGWVNSTYDIAEAGNYVVRFGVSNWSDTSLQSGMAFSGITIGGVPVESTLIPTGGSITIGQVDTGKMTAAAGTTLTSGIIDATDFVDLYSGGNMLTAAITAGTDLWAESGGTMTLGALSANDIELDSVGNMSFVSANAGTEFDFSSDASVNGGNVTAGNQISGDADGSVTLANLTVTGPPQEDENFSIGITALGNIMVGNVSGVGPVGFGVQGNLTTGNVAAGGLFLALVGGDTAINGSITTTGEDSQVYLADYAMCETGGGCTEDVEGGGEGGGEEEEDFDPNLVLALDPVMTGGSIAITGPVSTGVFRAAAGTSFTANAITAPGTFSNEEIFVEGINVRAGGLATINGTWTGPDVHVTSNDIDITATGSIQAGDVELYSTNSTQTVVGDGVAGGGYQLSDAEFDRINVDGELEVGAWVGGGAANRMWFGDLTYTDDSEGDIEIEFAVFQDDSETGAGSMRIVGDMVFNGMGEEDSVGFSTGLFELDAATGSLALYSSGTTLGGELEIQAPHIRVASGQILDQLAVNPTYSGYQQDLNEPATVQRPEGVIKAASISLDLEEMGSSATIYVQNTGTAAAPAGFLVSDEIFVGEDGEFTAPAGSVNLIINGQIVTAGGTLTGVAVRDALVADQGDTTAFTANSTINGCPLTGQCVIKPPAPPPTATIVENQIDLISNNPIGDSNFGNEDSIDDNEEGGEEAAENPISPPQPLFDTRPLIPSGDVDDPVSGTGNPALLGSDADCEGGEDGQCPVPASDGEGQ